MVTMLFDAGCGECLQSALSDRWSRRCASLLPRTYTDWEGPVQSFGLMAMIFNIGGDPLCLIELPLGHGLTGL